MPQTETVGRDTSVTREQAQRRVDRVAAFRAELAQLEADGVVVLPPDQVSRLNQYHDHLLARLASRFDVDRSDAEKRLSLGMRVASLLGAVALSAAVFLFFYRFWGALSVPVQVALLVAAPVLASIGVEAAARREKTLYFASLLALVALAAFVLDLNVIGTIFNLPPSPGAFLAWGLFALVLAYAYRLRLLLLVGIVCSATWLAGAIVGATGAFWPAFIMRPETIMLAGALALAASHFHSRRGEHGFALVYRWCGWVGVLVPIFFLSQWGGMTCLPLTEIAARRLYDVAGFALGGVILWRGIRSGSAETLNVGGFFLGLFLVLKLYNWCWDVLPRYVFFLLVAAVAIAALVALQRVRGRATAA